MIQREVVGDAKAGLFRREENRKEVLSEGRDDTSWVLGWRRQSWCISGPLPQHHPAWEEDEILIYLATPRVSCRCS